MAVGLFELARVVGNDTKGAASCGVDGAADASVCGVTADCRTCGKTALIWLLGGATFAADACGNCASIENFADCFALILLSNVLATDCGCDVLIFCMLKV